MASAYGYPPYQLRISELLSVDINGGHPLLEIEGTLAVRCFLWLDERLGAIGVAPPAYAYIEDPERLQYGWRGCRFYFVGSTFFSPGAASSVDFRSHSGWHSNVSRRYRDVWVQRTRCTEQVQELVIENFWYLVGGENWLYGWCRSERMNL